MKLLIIILLFPIVALGQKQPIKTDLIIYNARIFSGPYSPVYKAMVINKGIIIKLYNDDSWSNFYKSDNKIDLGNKVVMPGFIDAHCHFLGLGKAMDEVNLWGCRSWYDVISRIVDFVAKNPEIQWIQGRGWDQNEWDDKQFPSNNLLDSIFPEKYILLKRVDGHAIIANSNLLNYAGITTVTKCEGGKILTLNGKLTGVLIDNATELVEKKVPQSNITQKTKWLINAQKECLKFGITQIADAGLPMKDILLIDSLCKANILKIRFYLMANADENLQTIIPIKNKNINFQSVKIYSDGALGSRGALLKKPYCDDNKNYGLSLIEPVKLDSLLQICYLRKFQVCTHAIGDSANSLVLKAYSKYLKTTNNYRWRIEHAQIIDTCDLKYFRNFSIIPSIQPTHATSDMGWAENRLCKNRMNEAYIYKSLLISAGIVAFGTDFPVEEVSPFNTIRASRFRQNIKKKPEEGFNRNESLNSTETFAAMSIWAAKANFWEDLTGTLESGKFADFIILEKNPFTVSFDELKNIKVIETYIGGIRLFKN